MALALAAGDLRHVISIQAKIETTDLYGGQIFTWANVAAGVRCKKTPLSGKEKMQSRAEYSEISTRFRMRYRSGVTPAMRIVESTGEVHEIISVANIDGMNRELEILAKSLVNADVS